MTLLLAAIPGHVLDPAKRPLFLLLIGFIVTFAVARLNTRLARAHGGSGLHMSSIVTPGGLHIHHAIFGIIGMVVAGILVFAAQPGSPWLEALAFIFGSGAALTLDEFALILHLEDVYWTGEGRKSIDAIILGVTFITLLLTGLLPRTFNEVGDYIIISRWVGSLFILSGAFFVVICYLKGKLFVGTVGIFVPPVALVGALRLAKPGSPWARRQYADNPAEAGTLAAPGRGLPPEVGAAQASPVGPHRRQAAPLPAAPTTGTVTATAATGARSATVAVRPATRASRTSRALPSSVSPAPARYHVGMDGSPAAAPPRGRHEMLDEALDLIDEARADGVDLRLVGGLAVLALCTGGQSCRAEHRDLDLVAPRASARKLLGTLSRLGFEENRHIRFASGGALLQVYRPCRHPGPEGRSTTTTASTCIWTPSACTTPSRCGGGCRESHIPCPHPTCSWRSCCARA